MILFFFPSFSVLPVQYFLLCGFNTYGLHSTFGSTVVQFILNKTNSLDKEKSLNSLQQISKGPIMWEGVCCGSQRDAEDNEHNISQSKVHDQQISGVSHLLVECDH